MRHTRTIASVAFMMAASGQLDAQLPSASARGFGMGGNYSAEARGFDAVAWNPAMLGMPGASSFTINILSAGGVSGLNPVKYNDIASFGGKVIPATTKEEWLARIGTGTEKGTVDGGVSAVALSIGRFGFQLGGIGAGAANINQDAAEMLLFGNAGRTGAVKSFTLAGSNASGTGFGTAAASVALPAPFKPTGRAGEAFSIGVTAKYIFAGVIGRGQDNQSTVTPDNIKVAFPVIYTDANSLGDGGSGVGLDLGLAWSAGGTTLGLTARNVVNSFAWSTTGLRFRAGVADFDGSGDSTNFKELPYASAPLAMRTAIEQEKFKPEIAFGFSRRMTSLTLTVDGKQRFGDGIEIGPKMHVGVGAEFRGIPILPLRAGIAAISDGYQAAGGVGLKLGRVELGAGVSMRSRNSGTETGAMLSLFTIR